MKNEYYIIDGVVHIECYRKGEKHICLVDEEDLPKLLEIGNKINLFKNPESYTMYAVVCVEGKVQRLHRVLLNPPEDKVVDHWDRNGLNNTRANMRVVTQAENLKNKRDYKPYSSHKPRRGTVFLDKSYNKYRGCVIVNKKRYMTKRHEDKEVVSEYLSELVDKLKKEGVLNG